MPLNRVLVVVRLHVLKGDLQALLKNVHQLVNEGVARQLEILRLLKKGINVANLGWQVCELVALEVNLPQPL